MKSNLSVCFILFPGILTGFSQGFINLNFENATIVSDPSGDFPSSVYASNAIPGWTAYINGTPQTDIIYNTRTLDAAAVTLQGTNSEQPAIQGKYSVLLLGSSMFVPSPSTAAIGQTGQIPLAALSLLFWGSGGNSLQITFAGQLLSFNTISNAANYTVYGTDISAYAGQTGELLFTAPGNGIGYGFVDNIQFSDAAVPEPSTFGLFALGGLILACRRWRK